VLLTGLTDATEVVDMTDVRVEAAVGGRELPESHRRLLEGLADELARRDPDGRKAGDIDDPERAGRDVADGLLDTAALWERHLGGFYDVDGVRRLLGRGGRPISKQAVSKRKGLLALRTGSGRVVYPVFQFQAGGPFHHVAELLEALPEHLVSRWTLASWLVSPEPALGGERPIDVIAEGHGEQVVRLARRWASSLAA
jgi:hypothetical protein